MARIVVNPTAIAQLLRGRTGPVSRYVILKSTAVQSGARVQVGKDSRNLEHSIVKRISDTPQGVAVAVGSTLPYARLHHEGTRPHEIVPSRASVLRFQIGGVTVFTTRVKHPGTRPNRYLVDPLRRAFR